MPYDDDDDLFGEEFDFVDDDDVEEGTAKGKAKADSDEDAAPAAKPRRRPPAKDKPAPERPRPSRAKPASGPPARRPQRAPAPEVRQPEPEPAFDPIDDEPLEEVAEQQPAATPSGPPMDHVVHIYQYGKLKRTLPRKFTDEQAVGFAEEYTRTGKPYGRYAVATPDDEVPSQTFAGASRGT